MKKVIILLVTVWLPLLINAQWVIMGSGLNPHCYTSVGSNLYIGRTGVYLSSNNGANFTQIGKSTLNGYVKALGVYGARIFAGTSDLGGGGFYYTTDGDTNWTQTFLSPVENILVTPSYIYTISQNQVWRSSNNGVSFVQTSAPASTALGANASGSMIYCGGFQGLYSSSNNGSSWTLLNTLDTLRINDIGVRNNSNIFVCTQSSGLRPGSIWVSTNSGGNWSRIQLFADNRMGYYSLMLIDNNVLVGCDSGVVLSRNNGANWILKSEGLNNNARNVFKLYYADNYVFATLTYGELYRRLYSDAIIVKQISSEIPESYNLSQNYPNPFNPSTKIRFDIPKNTNVKISIYDISGRLINQLLNEYVSAGSYELNWNADNIPAVFTSIVLKQKALWMLNECY